MNTDSLPILFELILCVIDTAILYRFASLFLKRKMLSPYSQWGLAIIHTLITFVLSFIAVYSTITTLILTLTFVVYIFLVFEGSAHTKIRVALIAYVCLGVITAVVQSLIISWTPVTLTLIDSNIFIWMGVGVGIKCIYLLSAELGSLIVKGEIIQPFIGSRITHLLFISTFLMLLVLFDYLVDDFHTSDSDAIHYMIFFFGVFFSLLFVLIILYSRQKHKALTYKHLLQELKLKEQADLNLLSHNMEFLKTKHDLKNHLISLKSLLEIGKAEEADTYITSLLAQPTFKTYVHSKNDIINALLNSKIAENPSIRFHIRLNIEEFPFHARHLTVILGNILDNAIEAVTLLTTTEKEIEVIITENHDYGKIVVINPFDGELEEKEGQLFSRKGKARQGIGLMNVQQMITESGGKMIYATDNQIFRVTVLLKKEG
ncbi:sensor histidine kinase [Fundicoccus ignavus]|uniref:GHKL domain-containing protein n=2 Tax=Fundicoccus ignavus TaxID=2664442 RepID=A0A6I2GJH3_9LACT|nr:GHKL domain-containing protein [Fundicoccus ignavus]MRI80488.1 GHKL domain-containing protein [Fundicoccus ignavus]MRI84738.1 GHKL domain-containing protein [Fundicoccus ignavus]MRJ48508.1 GHKL domain-containing protein [Fundicoccus ignavus]